MFCLTAFPNFFPLFRCISPFLRLVLDTMYSISEVQYDRRSNLALQQKKRGNIELKEGGKGSKVVAFAFVKQYHWDMLVN